MTEKIAKTETKEPLDNIIYIGQKPFLNYVTAVTTQFQTKNQSEVIIIARGKFISRAVDISEVIRKKFLKEENIILKGIKIDSEEFENIDERTKKKRLISVSTIEITLSRPQ